MRKTAGTQANPIPPAMMMDIQATGDDSKMTIFENTFRLLRTRQMTIGAFEREIHSCNGYLAKLARDPNPITGSVTDRLASGLHVTQRFLEVKQGSNFDENLELLNFLDGVLREDALPDTWSFCNLNRDDPYYVVKLESGPAVRTIEEPLDVSQLDDMPNWLCDGVVQHISHPSGSWGISWAGYQSVGKVRSIDGHDYDEVELIAYVKRHLESIDSDFYIYRAAYSKHGRSDSEASPIINDVYEAYLKDNTGGYFLCDSLETQGLFHDELATLYKTASHKAEQGRGLKKQARNLVERYNRQRKDT